MKTILYLHGFNSSGESNKAQEMRERLAKNGCALLSPTLDYKNFDTVPKLLRSLFLTKKPQAVVGTSLGAFLAIYCSAVYHVPCVAVNPVLRPQDTLRKMIGENRNYVTKQRYIFTDADLRKYEEFHTKEFSKLHVGDNVTFVLANDDEVLGDHHYLEDIYPECHNFHYFDGQGHRFTSVKTILSFLPL